MKFNLTELPVLTNNAFYPMFRCKDRYLVLWGGAGSGKSYFTAEKILCRILAGCKKGVKHKMLCLRKTQPAVRKSVFALFTDYIADWQLGELVKVNKTLMEITFFNGSQIICSGLDDPEKIKSIQGITGIWLEEATEFTLADFTQLDLRLRGRTASYKQIILSFNPVDKQSWLKSRFSIPDEAVEKVQRIVTKVDTSNAEVINEQMEITATLHHSTFRDNRFLDATYIAILENLIEQDSNYYNVYNKGQWGVLQGLVYTNWDIVTEWPAQFDAHGYGLDFGFTNHPTALIEVGFVGSNLYERQLLYDKNLTNPAICRAMDRLGVDGVIVVDNAEPKSRTEICNAGFNAISCEKGKDSIVHGIDLVKRFNVHIHVDSTDLIDEKNAYKWGVKDGKPTNKPVDYMNHLLDAERYIVGHLKGKTVAGMKLLDLNAPPPDDSDAKTIIEQRYRVKPPPAEQQPHQIADIENERLWVKQN